VAQPHHPHGLPLPPPLNYLRAFLIQSLLGSFEYYKLLDYCLKLPEYFAQLPAYFASVIFLLSKYEFKAIHLKIIIYI
jgi:hypothetical protein